jgi:hypothetical protein
MASLLESAACIGVSGDFSVIRDYLGFTLGRFDSTGTPRGLPPDPTGALVQVSLLRQIERLEGEHYDINIIRIGSDNFSDTDYLDLDYGIFKLRNIYNDEQVGIGKVEWYFVLSADADGLDTPNTEDELDEITHHWTVPNDALDIFVPFNMNVPSNGGQTLGLSPVDGPCDKSDPDVMNGSVTGLWNTNPNTPSDQTARTFAHEIGHYLGLPHRNSSITNLMCQSGTVLNNGGTIRTATNLTDSQGDDIKEHCFMNGGC